ncbi:50S ribosomal protein L10 [Anabaena cylindrica FACHB-243]|uniref:Large ribosomal subunit protein uL10 n=1 Tax=Anabaena cylindrica (strain ATCC 27899 / PCC 7122) TaxID=272123 RepID=K9ZFT3_ANACC|nr:MULTISPECIES: 50S ribosomal protein L10 [Anabaena]AFZ58056.1 LSU ribosomal protein L10P [Anabaena cylindrica PCC 7122]MBD2419169.1 50S ribosomal protein L10 [Anabaena cylindrica FACHB-243]MBY5284010.1 50S ribosomal protein L10 [Anabaena sp. CCAP 1446/1C]MBY5306853.1 50S ribosomal protein L10 [Anabaena sp. CCAP 1446/1C]MCM2409641.1 50S ribosomal protein L10 [Anabaena sp. CCAP 1446/1C]
MGRTLENKKEIVADLKVSLSESTLALVIDYQGLTVAEITDLRRRLRPSGTVCKVTKNTFMGIAIQDEEKWQPLSELLNGASAFLLVKEDFSSAIKSYQEFQKVTKKTALRGGVMDGRLLKETDVKALGDLPSKEQLMAQIAGAINALATKVAVGINEVPSSLARALQAVAEKEEGSSAESSESAESAESASE